MGPRHDGRCHAVRTSKGDQGINTKKNMGSNDQDAGMSQKTTRPFWIIVIVTEKLFALQNNGLHHFCNVYLKTFFWRH